MAGKIVVGNWKMNGSKELLNEMTTELGGCSNMWLAVPNLFLGGNSKVKLGAQNCSEFDGIGAYTGEISAELLRSAGCEFVIVGHSERRQYFGDSAKVNTKIRNVLTNNMTAILCVGESLDEKKSGDTKQVVRTQIKEAFQNIDDVTNVIIAYEPVWAIGTGEIANAEDISGMCAYIKEVAGAQVLYGGSVNGKNSAEILSIESVDGVLVGGASLKTNEMQQITAEAASNS